MRAKARGGSRRFTTTDTVIGFAMNKCRACGTNNPCDLSAGEEAPERCAGCGGRLVLRRFNCSNFSKKIDDGEVIRVEHYTPRGKRRVNRAASARDLKQMEGNLDNLPRAPHEGGAPGGTRNKFDRKGRYGHAQ